LALFFSGTKRGLDKHPLRAIDATINYVDNFSDLPVDVDGDGAPDVVSGGKAGLYLVENLTKSLKNSSAPGR
jgi:hypothetical protein